MTLLATVKARLPEFKKGAVAVLNLAALAVSVGILHGSALADTVLVLGIANAAGVIVWRNKPSVADSKIATAAAIAEALAKHDGPITATVLTSPTPPPTPGATP